MKKNERSLIKVTALQISETSSMSRGADSPAYGATMVRNGPVDEYNDRKYIHSEVKSCKEFGELGVQSRLPSVR